MGVSGSGSRTLFDERGPAVLEALVAGVSIPDAARAQAVSDRTVKGWLRRGRDDPGSRYGPFAAEADARRRARELPPNDALPADRGELLMVASRAARKGNVQAMRLVWEMLRAGQEGEGVEDGDDQLAEVDELARRRAG